MTSQSWQDTTWKHQVFLYKPAKIRSDSQALLLVDGGAWKDELEAPAKADEELPGNAKLLLSAADMLQAPIVVVRQVPQQPLFNGLYEDAIISLTFARFMLGGEGDWPLLLPMVKSAVRAMDTAQELAQKEWNLKLENFIVTGASKRGWTTWLTATHDKRVNAIAPMVIDTLNMAAQLKQQLAYYGQFSDQLKDYTSKGLPALVTTPRGKDLIRIVDPFEYREQLTLPKLIILATNDRYWTVDALNVYYDQLQGEKYILYVPNNGHGIKDYPRLLGGLGAMYQHMTSKDQAGKDKLPKLTWEHKTTEKTHKIAVKSDQPPRELTLWTAESKTRDFRDATFVPKKLDITPGETIAEAAIPSEGFSAVFVEAQYNRQPYPLPLSTTIMVLGSAAAE
jgi:PhoPQ-activated pathogenicity-related protein